MVKAAHGETELTEMDTVLSPICDGIFQEAYNEPRFSSSIVAVHLLSENFEVTFSSSSFDEKCGFFVREKIYGQK